MKALVGAFNQEKALVGAFSVIVKTGCGADGALHSTTMDTMDRVAVGHARPESVDIIQPRTYKPSLAGRAAKHIN